MIERLGDWGQIVSPLCGIVHAGYRKDGQGLVRLAVALIINQIALTIFKKFIPEARPNGKRMDSFPSGHTAAAFVGAGFIARRYGLMSSLPVFVLAIFVGYSRIYARAHWLSDVMAGACLGLIIILPIKPYKKLIA